MKVLFYHTQCLIENTISCAIQTKYAFHSQMKHADFIFMIFADKPQYTLL